MLQIPNIKIINVKNLTCLKIKDNNASAILYINNEGNPLCRKIK